MGRFGKIGAACAGLVLALAACAKKGGLSLEKAYKVGAEPEYLALSDDGEKLAVSCSRSNDVWILDLGSGQPLRIDTEPRPAGLRFDAEAGKILVAESDGENLAQISLDQARVTRRFKVLAQPERFQPLPFSGGARTLVTSLTTAGTSGFSAAAASGRKRLSCWKVWLKRSCPPRTARSSWL